MSDSLVLERMYAIHIFLAAPPETAPEIVESKRTALAAETSEDEATKLNGGDLGYSSTNRMPPDFIAAVAKLVPVKPVSRCRPGSGFTSSASSR